MAYRHGSAGQAYGENRDYTDEEYLVRRERIDPPEIRVGQAIPSRVLLSDDILAHRAPTGYERRQQLPAPLPAREVYPEYDDEQYVLMRRPKRTRLDEVEMESRVGTSSQILPNVVQTIRDEAYRTSRAQQEAEEYRRRIGDLEAQSRDRERRNSRPESPNYGYRDGRQSCDMGRYGDDGGRRTDEVSCERWPGGNNYRGDGRGRGRGYSHGHARSQYYHGTQSEYGDKNAGGSSHWNHSGVARGGGSRRSREAGTVRFADEVEEYRDTDAAGQGNGGYQHYRKERVERFHHGRGGYAYRGRGGYAYRVHGGYANRGRGRRFELPYRGTRGGQGRREKQNSTISLSANRTGFGQVDTTGAEPIQSAVNAPAPTAAPLESSDLMQPRQNAGSIVAGPSAPRLDVAGQSVPPASVPLQGTRLGQRVDLPDITGQKNTLKRESVPEDAVGVAGAPEEVVEVVSRSIQGAGDNGNGKERIVEEAVRILEEYSMPGFDAYNRGSPHPLLDYVKESGGERVMDFIEWRNAVVSSIKPNFDPLSNNMDALEMGRMPGHARFVGFAKWVDSADKVGQHNPYTRTLVQDIEQFQAQCRKLENRLESWSPSAEARDMLIADGNAMKQSAKDPVGDSSSSEKPAVDGNSAKNPPLDGDSSEKPATDGDSSEKPATDGDSSKEPATDGDSSENPPWMAIERRKMRMGMLRARRSPLRIGMEPRSPLYLTMVRSRRRIIQRS